MFHIVNVCFISWNKNHSIVTHDGSANVLKNTCFCIFFTVPENSEEKLKRQKIETALKDASTPLSKWQEFAKSDYGLVSGTIFLSLFWRIAK